MDETTLGTDAFTWEPFHFDHPSIARGGTAIRASPRSRSIDARPLDEWLRARARLVRFARITSAATAGLAARAALGRAEVAASAEAARGWARRVVRELELDLTVEGSAPPPGSLLVANHRSYIDIPAILAAAPAIFLAKVEVGGWPVLGLGARIAHTVFVCREDPASRKRAILSMQKVLDHGVSIALFPEGTTSSTPGMLPFHPGSFRMSAARNYRVVPLAIQYPDPEDAWIDDESFVAHFLRRNGRRHLGVSLSIGPTLHDDDPTRLQTRAEDWILERIGGHR